MAYNAKYVVLDYWIVDFVPIIFPSYIGHGQMMEKMGFQPEQVVAAGFVEVDEGGAVRCMGESKDLKKGSRGVQDEQIIARLLKW